MPVQNFNHFIVDKKSDGLRIDRFVNKNNKDFSRTKIKNLILQKKIKLNNKIIIEPSKKVFYGDSILFEMPEPEKTLLEPYDYNLNIVFEDKDLLIIDKSAGISMHPGAGNYTKTIVNALINLNNSNLSDLGDDMRPGIVHRIDKDTSGLIVVAKNNKSHENLSKQFSEHTISRVYKALVWGKLRPSKGKIETLITRSSRNRQMMEASFVKGKKSITNYKTIEIFENDKVPTFSLVECRLETGRTHQIRVHLSHKGNNILGDKKYKKRFKKINKIDASLEDAILRLDRQFLHAETLGFLHPRTSKKIEFFSKLPKELNDILKKLRIACK